MRVFVERFVAAYIDLEVTVAARVRPVPRAVREVPGVQPRQLHHVDQVRGAGDGPRRRGAFARHIRAGCGAGSARYARDRVEGLH